MVDVLTDRFIGVCINEGQVHALVEVSHVTAFIHIILTTDDQRSQ